MCHVNPLAMAAPMTPEPPVVTTTLLIINACFYARPQQIKINFIITIGLRLFHLLNYP